MRQRRDSITIGSSLLIGGGLVLLGMALEHRRHEDVPPPKMPSMGEIMLALRPPPPPAPAPRSNVYTHVRPLPLTDQQRLERERLVRVYVYRIQIGDLQLASPWIPSDLSPLIADRLEGRCPALPSGNAEGAMPLDWQ